ncbi:YraN family protein [Ruminococcaceae bacterium OttesenSCG-928-D13]|nr:YraN family protein [Ruminococcaceae bacterium OttesenSCG-928-D13]
MKNRAQATGQRGEAAAAEYYLRQGYRLVEQGFRTRFGEIDLILAKGEMIVFCEVKTRGPHSLDRPAASVDSRKQHKLVLAAQGWLAQHKLGDPMMRFDVAEVFPGVDGNHTINLIENAF